MRLIHLLLLCAVLLTVGQVLWKHGLQRMGGFDPTVKNLGTSLLALVISPYIVAGLVAFIVGTVLWLKVLSNVPLSLAYPMMSISYVLGVIVGALFFREQVPLTRWLGTIVVCFGIYLISWR